MDEWRNMQKENFTSYLKEDENENYSSDRFRLKLLLGEIEAARVNNVCMYTMYCAKDDTSYDEQEGALIITNFRLAFLSVKNEQEYSLGYQKNTFLGKYDISLSNIDKIIQLTDRKKRAVSPQAKNSAKIEIIQIVCKNFRILTFGFKKAGFGKGKYIADALVKFAFPAKHNLLFLYNYKEKYYHSFRPISMFNKRSDWWDEIKRCGAEFGWRVLSKEKLDIDSSLPMNYVVPKHLTDLEYNNISRSFRNSRSAIWVWSKNSAALVRMAELSPEIASATIENIMLEHVRKCDPSKRPPYLMELSKLLPSIQEVNLSYLKLRKLCTPENDREFMAQDSRFYTLLEKTYWLLYISVCIKQSVEAAKILMSEQTVVLQEINSRDMCSVISSLIQLLLDSSFRTINGFQTLIQKEWISLGHPFSDRIGHVCSMNSNERSPLFLLFLDCVWQLLHQFPEEFEFSETFLTSLWDSVFVPIFDTFQFNCETDRQIASLNDRIVLRPVWDWGEQYSDKDIALFSNPLYKKTNENLSEKKQTLPKSALPFMDELRENNTYNEGKLCLSHTNCTTSSTDTFLEPSYDVRDIEVWHQCYFRWIPFLEIRNGGNPQIDWFNRSVQYNIHKLQRILFSGNITASDENILFSSNMEVKNGKNTLFDDETVIPEDVKLHSINSFFPFTSDVTNIDDLIDILVTNDEFLNDGSILDSTFNF